VAAAGVAAEVAAVELDSAAALEGLLIVDSAGFEAGQRDERLNVEPGEKFDWMARLNIGLSGFSTISSQSLRRIRPGELVGVVGWAADHGQHFARPDVECDNGAPAAFERHFGDDLQVEIDR
jgi:hypothetical protein